MTKALDLIDQRFGRLTVLTAVASNADGRSRWLAECACTEKNRIVVIGKDLVRGHTRSCGCLPRETTSKIKLQHGESRPETPEYRAWKAMLTRCGNPNTAAWANYGGRGITVCLRWIDSYDNFLADMGRKPTPRHSLDRYPNNDGNYDPGNCRWATRKEQNLNQRRNLRTSPS